MLNPRSPTTYYRRHTLRSVLLLALISLVTAGVYLMGALLSSSFEAGRSNFWFLSKFSIVSPESDENGADPAVIAQIRANPGVEQVIPAATIYIGVPSYMGSNSFNLLGLMADDLPYILERCGATLKEGKLPEPGTNGLVVSEMIANSLEIKLGDIIHGPINPELYNNVLAPLEVVGIVESDVRLGIVSLEYLTKHEYYRGFADLFLVVAHESQETAVDNFLRSEIQSPRTTVHTLQKLNDEVNQEYLEAFGVLAPSIIIVAIAFALVIATTNWVAYSRRLPEFGILYAVGYSRKFLIRRLTMETATLALLGWGLGIGLSWLILFLLNVILFVPRGQDLSILQLGAVGLTIPLPVAVTSFAFFSIRGIISHLDPIAIVERGELSQEMDQKLEMTSSKSLPKPLSSTTFYKRHKRRAVLLISVMSMMIVAVMLIVFVFDLSHKAKEPALGFLSQVSWVRSHTPGEGLDPGIAAQVRTHPAVARVIPVAPRFHMLGVKIPPFTETEGSPFGVYAEDMAFLVDLYDLKLKEGQLPRPYTNEMVIPETIAQNRALKIGDVIGDPDQPAFPGADVLPTEFIIVGIFAKHETPESENWWGFVSLEFLESNDAFDVSNSLHLFVVPKPGQKEILDDWLENELVGEEFVQVMTYRQEVVRGQEELAGFMKVMALIEIIIAFVAASALAGLSYIFISQRQVEFGVLHALGFKRIQLIWRVLQEIILTTGVAWFFSTILGLILVLYMRFCIFAPLGLVFDLFNISAWLYTLPIPLAVLAVTAGTTAWTLSKLDPVSIIERR